MKRRILNQILIVAVCLLCAGNRPDCDRRPRKVVCSNPTIMIELGECVDITNPCDRSGDWDRVDDFLLCDAPDGIFLRTNRSRDVTTRQICASLTFAHSGFFVAEFIYAAPRESGTGAIIIIITEAVSVIADASPSSVEPGEEVNLIAEVTGGAPPYLFSWSSDPPGQISGAQAAVQYPVINPTTTATYTIVVVDDNGIDATASVVVNVTPIIVTASATPDTINSGGSAQLSVDIQQGDGNYIYSWTPAGTLSSATAASPVATPISTTTYTCDVTDGRGATGSDNVTVYVRGTTPLSACFTTSPQNPILFTNITFDATCSDGNIVLYSWWFFGDFGGPPDLTTIDAIIQASPFDAPGTYPVKLEIEERGGSNTASVIMDVTVQSQ